MEPWPGVQAEMWTWQSIFNNSPSAGGFPPRSGDDLHVPVVGSIPGCRFAGLVSLYLKALADNSPSCRQRLNVSGGNSLHENVADRGSLDRTGDHGSIACVGRHLIQQLVLRPAADDVNRADPAPECPPGPAAFGGSSTPARRDRRARSRRGTGEPSGVFRGNTVRSFLACLREKPAGGN